MPHIGLSFREIGSLEWVLSGGPFTNLASVDVFSPKELKLFGGECLESGKNIEVFFPRTLVLVTLLGQPKNDLNKAQVINRSKFSAVISAEDKSLRLSSVGFY